MAKSFMDRICDLIESPRELTAGERSEVLTAFEDTMAVAYAGWHDPVVQATLAVYRGDVAPLIDGTKASSVEHAALIHATAGHALIMTMFSSKPSAIPASLSCRRCWRSPMHGPA